MERPVDNSILDKATAYGKNGQIKNKLIMPLAV